MRGPQVRFKMPQSEGSLSFDDLVLGRITKTFSDLDDFVMARADGIPLYNFGCVIDDHQMQISRPTLEYYRDHGTLHARELVLPSKLSVDDQMYWFTDGNTRSSRPMRK